MRRTQAFFFLVLANATWGSAWPIAKLAVQELDPPLLAALRITLAASLLWLIVGVQHLRQIQAVPAIPGSTLVRMGFLGIAALGLSYFLIYSGIDRTTASDGSLMIIGEVIFTTLLAARLAHERLDRRKIGGIILGCLGVVVLVLAGPADAGGDSLQRAIGIGLILAGLFIQAAYSVLGAGMARQIGPLATLLVLYTGSLLVWVPWIGWSLMTGQFPHLSITVWLALLYLAAIPSVVCNLLWFAVIRRHGASLGAISLFVQPVVGSLIGVVVLHEQVTGGLLIGGLLILAALALLVLEPDLTPP